MATEKRVIILDDDPSALAAVQRVLKVYGFKPKRSRRSGRYATEVDLMTPHALFWTLTSTVSAGSSYESNWPLSGFLFR